MAVLVQIKNAHKSYGDQVLLDGAEATLTDDAQISSKKANRNFGSDESLQVTTADKGLIKFKLTPNLPVGTIDVAPSFTG